MAVLRNPSARIGVAPSRWLAAGYAGASGNSLIYRWGVSCCILTSDTAIGVEHRRECLGLA